MVLFGPAGAGKSSLLCTIDSLYRHSVSRIVETGTGTDRCGIKFGQETCQNQILTVFNLLPA